MATVSIEMDTIHNIYSEKVLLDLLESVRRNDIPKIRELVKSNLGILGYVYGKPSDGKTIIHIVCSSLAWEVDADTVKTLIKLGANLYKRSNEYKAKQAIHFAALSLNSELLEIICENLKTHEINYTTKGETALLLIIRDCDCESSRAIECIRVLLAHKVNVNKGDGENRSPIWYAAEKGYRQVVQLLLDKPDTDIDTHTSMGYTARELIIQNNLCDKKKLPPKKNMFSPLWSSMPQFLQKRSEEDVQDPKDIGFPEETHALIEKEEMKPEEQLLNYVRCNERSKIRGIVKSNPELLKYEYSGLPFEDKTIIQIVCSSLAWEVQEKTVKTLIKLGASLYKYSSNEYWGKQAIHFASRSVNPRLLKIICKQIYLKPTEIDSTTQIGDTALLIIIKKCDCESSRAIECIRVLLDHGADVNKVDRFDLSPILYAAWRGYREVVELLLDNPGTDIDTHTYGGYTARELIIQNKLYDKKKIVEWPGKSPLLSELCQTLRDRREDDFLELKITSNLLNKEDNGETMLEICAKLNLIRCAGRLVQLGANIAARKWGLFGSPMVIAAKNGHYEVFKEMCVKLEEIPEFLLRGYRDHQMEFKKCLELLLDVNKSLVNKKVWLGQTPLQFSSPFGNNDAIWILLKNGASLGDVGCKGRLPIDDIEIETLRKHFDNCITSNTDKIDNEYLKVTFDYKTLFPSDIEDRIAENRDEKSNSTTNHEASSGNNADTSTEINVIHHISKNKKLQPLLTHPLITSFIHIKWERIKYFIYANLFLYVIAWLSFILYALIFYNDRDYQRGSNVFEISLLVILWITFSIFIVKEIFQLIVSLLLYIKKIENYLEIAFIILIGFILCHPGHDENIKKQISAIAILVSSFQLVLLIGQLPRMSTYIEMLRTVSWSFSKLLLWNAIPILAFSLSFYTLFRGTARSDNKMFDNSTDTSDKNDVFDGVGVSLFKTFVMMTGEFDASDINFSNVPLSWLIFAFFIFMIVIVLSNLMNGLAVSDTQEIKSNAEILAYISRIDHISYIENMLLGNFSFVPSKFFKLCKLPNINKKISLPKRLSELACLFPNYLDCFKMEVHLNQKGRINLPHSKKEAYLNKKGKIVLPWSVKVVRLDKETMKNVRLLLKERKTLNKVDDSLQKKLENVEDSLQNKLQDVDNVLQKKIDAVDDSMQKKLQDVDDSLQKKIGAANDSIQKKFETLDESTQKLETKVDSMQKKLQDVDDSMQQKLEIVNNSLQTRLESMEEQQKLMLDDMNAISQNINRILERIK